LKIYSYSGFESYGSLAIFNQFSGIATFRLLFASFDIGNLHPVIPAASNGDDFANFVQSGRILDADVYYDRERGEIICCAVINS